MSSGRNLIPSEVFTKLDYKWSFLGLSLEHYLAPICAGYVVALASFVLRFSVLLSLPVALAVFVGIAILQIRRGPDYLEGLVIQILTPKHLTCLQDDTTAYVLPVGHEELVRLLSDCSETGQS